ncbi:MAG: gamma-glutamylcyclotransferase [Dehalococcoidales bacterium]|nr:gamma-glutamylcyclotransferase [Dehalococcoidales bacterium]
MYYFAYGSNLSQNQMKQRCPNSQPLFTATLPNYKLFFTGWSKNWKGGTATIKVENGSKVKGGIYEITEDDLTRLDSCEGYPTTYDKIEITAADKDSNQVQAITYMKSKRLEETQPSEEYLSVIQQGYKDWGIE